MSKLQSTIDTLQVNLQQQAFDVAVLNLWAHASAHTRLEADAIHAFTFRPENLTEEEKKKNRLARQCGKPPVYCDKNWHNTLRLKDDRLVWMPGIARPIPPGWTPAEAKAKL